MRKKKRKKKAVKIPEKIHEIISYLAHVFKNSFLEEDDLKQNMYLWYLERIKKHRKLANIKKFTPGYWFLWFKWKLKTLYRKEVNRICREWNAKLGDSDVRTKLQSKVGYISCDSRFEEKTWSESEDS